MVPRRPRHLPGRHPLPPPDLAHLPLSVHVLDQRERWWRIHTISFDALFFGRLRRYRFDDPERRFGVLYIAQRWSRALWEHPQQPDGIIYRSRHDPSKVCAALFDRCASA